MRGSGRYDPMSWSPPVRCLSALPLLAACAAPSGADSGEETTLAGTDSGTTPDEPDLFEPSPSWGATEVEAALNEAFALGLPTLFVARDAYLDLMSQGDEACPGDPEQLTDSVIYGCEAASGYTYTGVSSYYRWEGEEAAELGLDRYEELAGDFAIVDPSGPSMRVGGGCSWSVGSALESPRAWSLIFAGSWVDEGSEAWLGAGASAWLEIEGSGTEADLSFEASGGLGLGQVDLYLPGLVYNPDCDAPEGEISVRGTDTWWYTLALQPCEPCGEVRFQDGSPLGTACPDLSSWPLTLREVLEWP